MSAWNEWLSVCVCVCRLLIASTQSSSRSLLHHVVAQGVMFNAWRFVGRVHSILMIKKITFWWKKEEETRRLKANSTKFKNIFQERLYLWDICCLNWLGASLRWDPTQFKHKYQETTHHPGQVSCGPHTPCYWGSWGCGLHKGHGRSSPGALLSDLIPINSFCPELTLTLAED